MKLIAFLTIPVLMFWVCVLLLLCGCRSLDQKIIQESSTQPPPVEINPLKLNPILGGSAPKQVFYSGYSSSQLTIEHHITIYRVSWNPGAYSNFWVFASKDVLVPIAQWSVYTNTQDTNFLFDITSAPQRFFTWYGTNNETGESAWVVKNLEP